MEVNENDMEIGGINIHYLSYSRGSRRNFILLHDTSQTSESWAGIDALRKIGQWGYNVYAPDMPGFGKSDSSFQYNFVGSPSKGSDFIREFSQKLYLDNIVVVAPSASAGTALKSLIDNKSIIKSVIIIGGLGVDPLLNELNRIESPVLIMWGGRDNTVPIEHGIKYHDLIASSTFVKIDGAGHCVQMEKPDIFFNNVKKFLEGL
jgi:pimeloyl-ACP methyl ester carboxylesterase